MFRKPGVRLGLGHDRQNLDNVFGHAIRIWHSNLFRASDLGFRAFHRPPPRSDPRQRFVIAQCRIDAPQIRAELAGVMLDVAEVVYV